jgi:hypothetical protein
MDLESALIILIMLSLIIIPIMIINYKKKVRDRKFMQSLFDLAAKSHCKLTVHDKLEHIVIGIDHIAHKLFFIRSIEGISSEIEVDLTEVTKCRYINTNRSETDNKSSQTIIEKLELGLSFNDPKKPDLALEFYNSKYDSLSLRGEPELAFKWSDLINEELQDLSLKN